MTRFKAGVSGNPKGKPKGARDKRTAWRTDMGAELPALIKKLIELAKAGDLAAMSLILSRVCPPLRATAAPIELPALGSAATRAEAAQAVIGAVAAGQLGTDAATDLINALASIAKIVEVDELAARITTLEEAQLNDNG